MWSGRLQRGVTINSTGPYRTAVVILVHVFDVLQYLARHMWQAGSIS